MLAAVKEQQPDSLFNLTERPEWITLRSKPATLPAAQTGEHESPLTYLLLDYQTLVDATGNNAYRRLCYQIHDASCIEDMSQFLFIFRPESQHLSFHRCLIYRDDQTIDCLDPENIRCMQRELQLESHVSSDVITIEFIIDDLRIGDVVDIETSESDFKSEHPLHGHYIREGRSLAWSRSVEKHITRVVNKSDTNLLVQHLDSKNEINDVTTVASDAEFEKEIKQPQPVTFDDNLPAEYWPPYLFTTTETSWEETSAHLYSFYRQAGVYDPVELKELELTEVNEQTIINNIRFVQDNIRYRSESNGIFSHTPKAASKTLKKRTGDCKDKSTLLLSVLRAMGIEANLALVNTGLKNGIDTLMPSPFLFDHMIVHFIWQGKAWFVDATIQKQGGTLATMAQLEYRSALLLKADGGGLETIPYSTDSVVYKLFQFFNLSTENGSKPVVTYRREYFGARADNMRYYFSSNELKSIQQSYHDGISEQLEAKLTPIKSMHITNDSIQDNHFITEESYQIETPFFEINEGNLIIVSPHYQHLEISSTSSSPEETYLDGIVQQDVTITYPSNPTEQSDSFVSDNQWFNYSETLTSKENITRLNVTLTPLHNRIDPEQREDYLKLVDTLRNRAQTSFPFEVADTYEMGVEFTAIAAAMFLAMLAFTDKIPGEPVAYVLGIYGLYRLYTFITGKKE